MAYLKCPDAYGGLSAAEYRRLRAKFPPNDDVIAEVTEMRRRISASEAFYWLGVPAPEERPGWDDVLDAVAHLREVAGVKVQGVVSDENEAGTPSRIQSGGEDAGGYRQVHRAVGGHHGVGERGGFKGRASHARPQRHPRVAQGGGAR